MPVEPSDIDVVRAAISGDERAYAQVRLRIDRAFERAWARAGRRAHLASHKEDVRQSLEMHLVRDDFRVLGTFRAESRLSTWLHAVTMRFVLREVQRLERRRSAEAPEPAQEPASPADSPETEVVRQSERARVRAVLDGLSDTERALVGLVFEQGLDSGQAAQILGLSAAGVRMRKKRLLQKLEKRLREA